VVVYSIIYKVLAPSQVVVWDFFHHASTSLYLAICHETPSEMREGFRSHYLSFTKTMFFVKAYLEPETAISRCWFQISFMEMVKHQFFHVLILTHPIRGTANNHFLMDVW